MIRSLSPEIDLKPNSTNARTMSMVCAGAVRPRSLLAEDESDLEPTKQTSIAVAPPQQEEEKATQNEESKNPISVFSSSETSNTLPVEADITGLLSEQPKDQNDLHSDLKTSEECLGGPLDISNNTEPAPPKLMLPVELRKTNEFLGKDGLTSKKTFKRGRHVLGFQKSELKDSSKRLKESSGGKENKLCNENKENQPAKISNEKPSKGAREDLESLMYLAEQTLSKAAMGWFDVPSEDSTSAKDEISESSSRASCSDLQEISADGKKTQYSTGRWTAEEHERFLTGLSKYGKDWRNIAKCIRTRSYVQTRTHAQKYFKKVAKSRHSMGKDIPTELMSTANDGKKWCYDTDDALNITQSALKTDLKLEKISKDALDCNGQLNHFEPKATPESFPESTFANGFQLAGLHYLGALANPGFLAVALQQHQNQGSHGALQQLLQHQLTPFQCLPFIQYPVAKQQ